MILRWSVAAGVLGVATVFDVVAAMWVWRRGRLVGRPSLVVLLLAAAVWCAFYTLELATTGRAGREFWGGCKYVGTTLLPAAWLAFALDYTGRRDQLSGRLLTLLAIEPLAVWTLLAVPATRDLIRSFPPGAVPPVPVVRLGPLYWVHFAYTNALTGVATVILVGRLLRVSFFYRRQSVTLLVAVAVPLIGNMAARLGLPFARRYDPTPIAVSLVVRIRSSLTVRLGG